MGAGRVWVDCCGCGAGAGNETVPALFFSAYSCSNFRIDEHTAYSVLLQKAEELPTLTTIEESSVLEAVPAQRKG